MFPQIMVRKHMTGIVKWCRLKQMAYTYTGHHPSKKEIIINWTKREDYPPKAKNGSHSLLSDGMSSHACTSKLAILKGTSNG